MQKKIFLFLMLSLFSIFFSISSISWFNFWIWLETNLILFIAFLIDNKNKLTIESSIIYFLIQAIASILFLFSMMMMMFMNKFNYLMMISILIKLGSSPFHYWIPLMIEGLNWMKIFFLLTFQKINPLIMLFYNNLINFLMIFIILSMTIGSLTSLNYSSLKKIISFSSINQLSWMMLSIMFMKLMKIYLLIYFFIMWSIIKMFSSLNLNFINQIYNLNLKNLSKLFIFMNLLSLGGLPPFLGFFPKLILIMKMNNYLIMMLMILFSLIILFMYIRLIYSMFMLNSLKINKIFKINNKNSNMKLIYLNMLNNSILLLLFFYY